MSDLIRLLPDTVANQIAAGEVIQRPASAVKELLENAVDAGASKIDLIVKDAGKTLIQVIDNGTGMSKSDAKIAFERHATSKIKTANDLFDLHTNGLSLVSFFYRRAVNLHTGDLLAEVGVVPVKLHPVTHAHRTIKLKCGDRNLSEVVAHVPDGLLFRHLTLP